MRGAWVEFKFTIHKIGFFDNVVCNIAHNDV